MLYIINKYNKQEPMGCQFSSGISIPKGNADLDAQNGRIKSKFDKASGKVIERGEPRVIPDGAGKFE